MAPASEEIGKVATSIVDSLKNSPTTLALIAFFTIFLVLFYLSTRETRSSMERLANEERSSMERLQTNLIAQQGKLTELLLNCVSGSPPK